MTKRTRLKKFYEYLKEDSAFSIQKVLATSLTAVIMTVVVTKLSNTLTGIIVAGVVSIISALIFEVIRMIVAASEYGAKKVIKVIPIDPIYPKMVGSTEVTISTSEENKESDQTNVEEIVAVEPQSKLLRFFSKRYYLVLILIFVLMSMVTVFVTANIAKGVEKTEVQYTTVQEYKKEELPEKEKEKIINSAVENAEEKAKATAQEHQWGINQKVDDVILENASLKEQILVLTEKLEKAEVDKLASDEEIKELRDLLQGLLTRIETLEKDIEELSNVEQQTVNEPVVTE